MGSSNFFYVNIFCRFILVRAILSKHADLIETVAYAAGNHKFAEENVDSVQMQTYSAKMKKQSSIHV